MHKSTKKKLGLRHIRRHKLIRALIVMLGLSTISGVGVTAGIIGAYYYVQPGLPPAETIRDIPLQIPLRIFSRDGYLISEIGERRRILVTYDELPQHVVDAFVAAEDQRFFVHPGIDYRGIVRAFVQLAMTGDISSGGSTLTQQLARDYFLTREQKFTRKLREAFLAYKIEQEFTKEQIMALFLNKMFLSLRRHRSISTRTLLTSTRQKPQHWQAYYPRRHVITRFTAPPMQKCVVATSSAACMTLGT
jgi:penicillin-binding protein 1A